MTSAKYTTVAEVFAAHSHVAQRLADRPPGYADMLAKAELRRDDRGVWYARERLTWPPAPVEPTPPPRPPSEPVDPTTRRTLTTLARVPWPLRGSFLWMVLRDHPAPSDALLDAVAPLLADGGCQCRTHFGRYRGENPPDFTTEGWPRYLWTLHNAVNGRRGVAQVPWAEAERRRADRRLPARTRDRTFARTVCINLDRRPERYARLATNVALLDGGWPFAPIQRHAGVDGHAAGVTLPSGWTAGRGGYGCSLSHRASLRQAVADGVDSLLVLEDDVLFRPDFSERATAFIRAVEAYDPGWEMLMFGGEPLNGCPPRWVAPGVARSVGTNRFHCYGIRGPLIADLLARLERSSGHCDIEPWDLLRGRKVYEPDPYYLAAQASGQSDIAGGDLTIRPWHKSPVVARSVLLHAPREVVEALAADGWHFGQHRDPATGVDVWLRDLPGKHSTPDRLSSAVRSFVAGIVNEAHAVGATPALWHPTMDAGMLRRSMPDPWVEVTAATAAEARAAIVPPVAVRRLPSDPPVPSDNPGNTLVIAPAFGYGDTLPESVGWMLASAARHGIVVTLVGTGQPYTGMYDAKARGLWEATRGLAGFDHILMVDAADVLFAAGLSELLQRFAETGHDFVVAGETNGFEMPDGTVPPVERFGFLNAGCWMGTWAAFQRVMADAAARPVAERQTDQAALWAAYLGGAGVTVDHGCDLFQCLYGVDVTGDADLDGRDRPTNLHTGSQPLVWHANGTAKEHLPALRERLGLA